MAKISDIVPGYFLALIDETRAAAKVATFRAAMDARARTEWAEQGSDRWRADGLGKSHVRLDGTQDGPKVYVSKPGELASYLAQHAPEHAVTTITVRAGDLAGALDALGFAGVDVLGADATPGPDATAWVEEHCKPVADPDADGWLVQHRADDGRVVTPDVPGLAALRRPARLVVSLDPGIKREVADEATRAAEDELALILDPAPAGGPADEPAPTNT